MQLPAWNPYSRDHHHSLHGIPTVVIPIISIMESLQSGSLSVPSWNPYSVDLYHSLHGIPLVRIPTTPFMESLQWGSLSFPSWNPYTRDPYLITFPLCCELPSLHCSINFLSHKSPKTSPLSLLLQGPYTLQTTPE